MTRESDDVEVTREHVRVFLEWYGARVPVSHYPGIDEIWFNALHTLTLGDLRHGMREFQRFTSRITLTPPQFWGLCTGRASELSIQRFNEMREKIKQGKVRIAPQYQPRKQVHHIHAHDHTDEGSQP